MIAITYMRCVVLLGSIRGRDLATSPAGDNRIDPLYEFGDRRHSPFGIR
jgi:hypothetical protein